PIAELGFFAACGVLISLCLTLLLLPALLAIVPAKPILSQGAERGTSRIDRILLGCGNLAVSRPWLVTATSFAVILVAAAGIFRLDFSHHVLHWFKANSEIRRNTELIDGKMKGSISMEIIVDTGVENGLYHPETMNSLDELEKKLMEYRGGGKDMFVGKTLSLADMLKEINQALNENRSEHYSIPQSRQAIAQELLLFENSGSDDLEDVVDSRFSKARLTAKVPWNDSVAYVDMLDYVRRQIKETFHDKHKITVTGLMVIMMETIFAMMQSTITSYAVAGVIITVLMILLIGRIRMGLISMIPNLSPIVITLGLMGWLGIKLDMFTLLIGSIAIGLAVDDTIHFFHNFRKYYEETGSTRKAVQETLTTAGRAMLVTTLVLTTGFWLFMFASMDNIFFFGLLTGLTIMFAFLADVLLAPALLTIITKSK
ncbi:MAG: MMPL family transporter, partial [Proteobacteria bacterium]|nr:MMPL family transporter [Pseudomonadota bacterium]